MQYPCSSSLQILMHGEAGSSRSVLAPEAIEFPAKCQRLMIELSGVVAYSSNARVPGTANNEPKGSPHESTQFSFRRNHYRHRARDHRV
ncbi:MAG TPA: hypothetical protein VH542_08895, partial [Steroidobacteraceae bacterium]